MSRNKTSQRKVNFRKINNLLLSNKAYNFPTRANIVCRRVELSTKFPASRSTKHEILYCLYCSYVTSIFVTVTTVQTLRLSEPFVDLHSKKKSDSYFPQLGNNCTWGKVLVPCAEFSLQCRNFSAQHQRKRTASISKIIFLIKCMTSRKEKPRSLDQKKVFPRP